MDEPCPIKIAERHALLARVSSGAFFDLDRNAPPAMSADLPGLVGATHCGGSRWQLPAIWRRLRRKDRRALRQAVAALSVEQPELTLELRAREKSHLAVRAVAVFDATGAVQRLVGTVEDVTHERRSAKAQRREAETDYLTGLSNRRAAQDQIQRFVREADEHPFALAFIDLNKFKDVNDRYGHDAGDNMLKAVARRLLRSAGRDDVVARLGGDEFMVLFHASDENALVSTMETARRAVEIPLTLDGGELVTPSVSVGATWVDNSDQHDSEVLREADMAMYISKEENNGEIVLFESSMQEARTQQKQLIAQLRQGMHSRDFELWYQPLVNTNNVRYLGFEALMRWRDHTGRVVPADEFVPILEKNRLITELTEVMLDRLACDLETWQRAGQLPDSVAFNLSPLQLSSDGLLDTCQRFLSRVDGLQVQIVFEVTETAVIENMSEARRILNALRGQGARIALDDFGVGYSSLAVLHQLPVEILKLDGEFANGLFSSDRSLKIVRAILELAATLSMPAVAERVENQEQADWLTEAGCTYLQGFLFSEPLTAEQTLRYMLHSEEQHSLPRAS